MRGIDILDVLSGDDIVLDLFGGIFAKDQLVFELPNKEIFFICNTDISSSEGKHWVVIYLPREGNNIEYFDSLGKRQDNLFVHFMSKSNRFVLYNKIRLQSSVSEACAYYCLYFVYFRCRGVSFIDILTSFSIDLNVNEKDVIKFIKESFV